MDVEESIESQNAAETPPQQAQAMQGHLHLLQDMQCDPAYGSTTNTTTTTNPMMDTSNIAIPLPAPPLSASASASATGIEMGMGMGMGMNIPASVQTDPNRGNSGVDGGTMPKFDIVDTLLLHEFSCLGTTDRNDLISQFQSLMNNQLNRVSASCYLEMGNWNLPAAVGCYLDYCSFESQPSMKVVQDKHLNAQQQALQLQNDGNERWPNGCFLTSPVQTERINVPCLRPGETCDILADLIPTQPPIMWRLCGPNGWYFGDAIWILPPGTQASQDELQQRMVELITSDVKPEVFPQIKIVITTHTQ